MLKLQEGKMSAYLDIIILLLVVVMVFAKLKSLLGTRPENETEISRESAAKIFDILMQEHNRKHGAQPTPAELRTDDENLSESEKALQKIPGFNRDKFLNSAKKAFEIIVTSFAKGDVKTLETLVSKNLLKKFKEIIGKRQEEGISAETDFIGFDEAVIADAKIDKNDLVKISVKFVSEQVNILRGKNGEVIEGDENFIQSITDVWTFERSLHATTPAWLLSSTKK